MTYPHHILYSKRRQKASLWTRTKKPPCQKELDPMDLVPAHWFIFMSINKSKGRNSSRVIKTAALNKLRLRVMGRLRPTRNKKRKEKAAEKVASNELTWYLTGTLCSDPCLTPLVFIQLLLLVWEPLTSYLPSSWWPDPGSALTAFDMFTILVREMSHRAHKRRHMPPACEQKEPAWALEARRATGK